MRSRTSLLWAGLFLRLSSRELQIAVLFVLFPALLAVVYSGAYGPSSLASSLRAIVVAEPAGRDVARPLAEALRSASFEGSAALTVYESDDLDASMRALRDGDVDLVLDASGPGLGAEGGAVAMAYSDPASATAPYAESLARAAAAAALGGTPTGTGPRTTASFTGGSGGANDFLAAIPGLFVFGWVFGAMTTALIAVREIRRRTIERSILAGAGVTSMAAGLWLAQATLGLLQAAVLWAVLPALGFPSPARILDAIVAVLLLDIAMSALATACGLATAALCSSEGVAVNLCMAFIVPLAFLSGAVFPLPSTTIAMIGGYAIFASDLLPSAPAARALELALVRGSGLSSALPDLVLAALGSAAWSIGGAALFSRNRLSIVRRRAWARR